MIILAPTIVIKLNVFGWLIPFNLNIEIECFRMMNFIQSGRIQIECFWVQCLYSMAVNARAGSESDDESSEDGCVEEPLDGVDDEGS